MNTNAANALLKKLEEPPSRTVFILIAHSLGRLLPTIRPRCQLIRFQPLGDEAMLAALKAIEKDGGRRTRGLAGPRGWQRGAPRPARPPVAASRSPMHWRS